MERKFSLKRKLQSRQAYSHAKTFGASNMPLPAELLFLTPVLNQGTSTKCTAFSSVSIRQSMTGRVYDPEAQFKEELVVYGNLEAQEIDLQTTAATGVNTGWVEQGKYEPIDKASAYYWVHPSVFGQDMFDKIRQTINQTQTPLSGGLDWFESYDTVDGVVPHVLNALLGGHDTKIAGFTDKKRDGSWINPQTREVYLCIQNSWGESMGDGGLFYFDRHMTNKVFTYGVFYWSDDPAAETRRLGLISAILVNLLNLYKRLLHQ